MNNEQLMHYGVLGMKWGVRRAAYKQDQNNALKKKAYNYDIKSAKLKKRSEKAHAKYDLETANRAAVKSANYDKKASKFLKKSLKTNDPSKSVAYKQRAATYEYKSKINQIDGNTLAKMAPYGEEAMKLSVESDIAKKRAAKARLKIAHNDAYIQMMKQRIPDSQVDQVRIGLEYINRLK